MAKLPTITIHLSGLEEVKRLTRQVKMFEFLQQTCIETEDWRVMLISTRELTPEEFNLPATFYPATIAEGFEPFRPGAPKVGNFFDD